MKSYKTMALSNNEIKHHRNLHENLLAVHRDNQQLDFWWRSAEGEFRASKSIKMDLESQIRAVADELNTTKTAIRAHIEGLGASFADLLLPDEIAVELARLVEDSITAESKSAESGSIFEALSLRIVSNDKSIPWELLCPRGSRPLGEALRLARWRFDIPCPRSLNLDPIVYVMSSFSGLDQANKEKKIIVKLAEKRNLKLTRLEEPTTESILDRLEDDPPASMHFIAHGRQHESSPFLSNVLLDNYGQQFMVADLAGRSIDFSERSTMIFLNTCESVMIGIKFVDLGASAVIGTQWKTGDKPALQMAGAFYRFLTKGHSISEAIRRARIATLKKFEKDTSAFAYTLFGHPDARLESDIQEAPAVRWLGKHLELPDLENNSDAYRPSSLQDQTNSDIPEQLRDLITWTVQESKLGIRCFTGPAGMGKIRFSVELCQYLNYFGWRAGFVKPNSDQSSESPSDIFKGGGPVLAVINYADSRVDFSGLLIRHLQKIKEKGPFRILILTQRGGGWWNQNIAGVQDCDFSVQSLLIETSTHKELEDPALISESETHIKCVSSPLRTYLYQVCYALKRWLLLPEGTLLRIEGDENNNSYLLNPSPQTLKCTINPTIKIVASQEIARRYISYILVEYVKFINKAPNVHFSFLNTSLLAEARGRLSFLASWQDKQSQDSTADMMRTFFLSYLESENNYRPLENAFRRLDMREEGWRDFVTAIDMRVDFPGLNYVIHKILNLIQSRVNCRGLRDEQIFFTLIVKLLKTSQNQNSMQRFLSAEDLRNIISGIHSRSDSWADSGVSGVKRVFNEVKALELVIYSPNETIKKDFQREPTPRDLLDAANESVPFISEGREEELERLEEWCSRDAKSDLLIVEGPPGSGKTRLFIEWCKRISTEGWIAGFLTKDSALSDRDLEILRNGQIPRFVVIDSAELNPAARSVLSAIAPTPNRGGKLRLAFVGRNTVQWWNNDLAKYLPGPRYRRLKFFYTERPLKLSPQFDSDDSYKRVVLYASKLFRKKLNITRNNETPKEINILESQSTIFSGSYSPRDPLLTFVVALAIARGIDIFSYSNAFIEILNYEREKWRQRIRDYVGFSSRFEEDDYALALETTFALITCLREIDDNQSFENLTKEVCHKFSLNHRHLKSLATDTLHVRRSNRPAIVGLQPDFLGEQLVFEVWSKDRDLLKVAFKQAKSNDSTKQFLIFLFQLLKNRASEFRPRKIQRSTVKRFWLLQNLLWVRLYPPKKPNTESRAEYALLNIARITVRTGNEDLFCDCLRGRLRALVDTAVVVLARTGGKINEKVILKIFKNEGDISIGRRMSEVLLAEDPLSSSSNFFHLRKAVCDMMIQWETSEIHTLKWTVNLCRCMAERGMLDEAFQKASNLRPRIQTLQGSLDPETLIAAIHNRLILGIATGRYQAKALNLFKALSEIDLDSTTIEPGWRSVLYSSSSLIHEIAGEWDFAKADASKAVSVLGTRTGEIDFAIFHPVLWVKALINLSSILRQMDQIEKSIEVAREATSAARAASRDIIGKSFFYPIVLADALNELSSVLRQYSASEVLEDARMVLLVEAEKYAKEAISIASGIDDPAAPNRMPYWIENLVLILYDMNRPDEARDFLARAIDLFYIQESTYSFVATDRAKARIRMLNMDQTDRSLKASEHVDSDETRSELAKEMLRLLCHDFLEYPLLHMDDVASAIKFIKDRNDDFLDNVATDSLMGDILNGLENGLRIIARSESGEARNYS